MTGSGSDYIVADSTLDRISFGCFSTVRCMISFVILSITAAAVVPVLGFVTAPFGRPVVTQSLAFDCVTSITGLRSGAGCIFPVMTESSDCNFAQIGRHKSIGILVKIAALALVVFLVTGVGAVSRLCFHLGQMGSADMTGSGSDYIAADGADFVFGLGCRSAGGVRHNSVLMIRVAGADMSMTVVTLITPYTRVKVVIIIECSVRNLLNRIAARIKQRAAEGALLIFVPTFFCTVGFLCRYSLQIVSTADLNCAGGGFLSCLCSDNRFAGGYCSYHTGSGINSCYFRFVGRPSHCISRVGRGDSCRQSFSSTDCQSQF